MHRLFLITLLAATSAEAGEYSAHFDCIDSVSRQAGIMGHFGKRYTVVPKKTLPEGGFFFNEDGAYFVPLNPGKQKGAAKLFRKFKLPEADTSFLMGFEREGQSTKYDAYLSRPEWKEVESAPEASAEKFSGDEARTAFDLEVRVFIDDLKNSFAHKLDRFKRGLIQKPDPKSYIDSLAACDGIPSMKAKVADAKKYFANFDKPAAPGSQPETQQNPPPKKEDGSGDAL